MQNGVREVYIPMMRAGGERERVTEALTSGAARFGSERVLSWAPRLIRCCVVYNKYVQTSFSDLFVVEHETARHIHLREGRFPFRSMFSRYVFLVHVFGICRGRGLTSRIHNQCSLYGVMVRPVYRCARGPMLNIFTSKEGDSPSQ